MCPGCGPSPLEVAGRQERRSCFVSVEEMANRTAKGDHRSYRRRKRKKKRESKKRGYKQWVPGWRTPDLQAAGHERVRGYLVFVEELVIRAVTSD